MTNRGKEGRNYRHGSNLETYLHFEQETLLDHIAADLEGRTCADTVWP